MWIEALSDILLLAEDDWPDQVRALIAGREGALLPAYREGIDHNGEVILQLSRDVLISRTEKQDRKLRGKLLALRDDLAALAAQLQLAPRWPRAAPTRPVLVVAHQLKPLPAALKLRLRAPPRKALPPPVPRVQLTQALLPQSLLP